MKFLRYGAYLLVLTGAINWGLIGFFNFNLIETIVGDMTFLARVTYSLVGLSAVVSMFILPKCDREGDNKTEYCGCSL